MRSSLVRGAAKKSPENFPSESTGLGVRDSRGIGSAGGNVGCECNARCPSLMRFWMRRVISSSRRVISSSSDLSSSSMGSGAARLLDRRGVCPRDGNARGVGLGDPGKTVSGDDGRVEDGRAGVLSNASSCCLVVMINSAMLGRLILRLRLFRDAMTLGAGDELVTVLTQSAIVSYAGGGSEWSDCSSRSSLLTVSPPGTFSAVSSSSSSSGCDRHPVHRRYAVLDVSGDALPGDSQSYSRSKDSGAHSAVN